MGSIWLTVFDGDRPEPLAYKESSPDPQVDGWLRVGESSFGPDGVHGGAGPATWDLTWTGDEPPLRHLPKSFMYSAPLPQDEAGEPAAARRTSAAR